MEKKKCKDRERNDENCNDMAIGEPGVFCSAVSISSILFNFITMHKALSINISTERRRNAKKK